MPAARSGIARRYAEAVFQIAQTQNSLDRWSADLSAMADAQQEPEIARVLSTPAVGLSAKESVLKELLPDLSREARNLVGLLLRKGRFVLAPQVAEHYRSMLNEHRGIATAEVTSAVALSAEELESVAHRLSTIVGRRVIAEHKVDPSIIGGIVARVGDQLIDASVKGRLEALKRRLAST